MSAPEPRATPRARGEPAVSPRRHSNLRLATFRAVERLLALLGGRRAYVRRRLSPGRLAWRVEEYRAPDLPRGLHGFRIAQLSDLHGGAFLSPGDLGHAIELVRREGPDLVVLTGDYLTHEPEEALALAPALAGLQARFGVFAVLGNHDYRFRREGEIVRAFGSVGIRFLRDASVRFDVAGGGLALVGLEDLEEGRRVDLARARAKVRPGDFEVHLCHNPLGAPVLARAGARIVLSGHTHGTQIDLPLLRRLGPVHPGARVELGRCTLFTCRGLGVVGAPIRVGAPAEVLLLRLLREPLA